MSKRRVWMLVLAVVVALSAGGGFAQGTTAVEGIWEGPWYRGMTSGRATLEVTEGSGTLQLTNGESFGEAPQRLRKLAVAGRSVSLQVVGEGGALLTVDLTLDEKADQMKGMGKYEGFTVRLELRRGGDR